jgi:tRNA-dihydrouridine synthase B
MGCPTPKITKSGEGSALMKTPELVGKIINAVCEASEKPVTVKIRKGWDDTLVNAPEIAMIAEQNGAQAVVIHGRTRAEFYHGKADWDIIKKVKEKIKIPVIGNGDIKKPEDAKSMLVYTGCDGVMIGRACEGNPWIFDETNKFLAESKMPPEKTFSEKLPLILQHIDLCIEYKGEYMAVRELRRHLSHYIRGLRNCSTARAKIFRAESGNELREILHELDRSESQ